MTKSKRRDHLKDPLIPRDVLKRMGSSTKDLPIVKRLAKIKRRDATDAKLAHGLRVMDDKVQREATKPPG
jgi:hypothetical protein